MEKCYICCDLKSFYASVECVERGLDPMTTNLVVADQRRTEKTICLAVSPSLKAYGISGRARLFEVVQKVREVNTQRKWQAPGHQLTGSSWHDPDLRQNPRHWRWTTSSHRPGWPTTSTGAPEDLQRLPQIRRRRRTSIVYSIDEVFIDATSYLDSLPDDRPGSWPGPSSWIFCKTTGITAAAGIGTNLYLAKVAMDIVAKHVPADEYGVRIAELDEMSYRRLLWTHRPLTDFWRVGQGLCRQAGGPRPVHHGGYCPVLHRRSRRTITTRNCSISCSASMRSCSSTTPGAGSPAPLRTSRPTSRKTRASSPGRCCSVPTTFEKARLVVREMADALALDLVDKGLVTNQLVLTVGYDIENLDDPERRQHYHRPGDHRPLRTQDSQARPWHGQSGQYTSSGQ